MFDGLSGLVVLLLVDERGLGGPEDNFLEGHKDSYLAQQESMNSFMLYEMPFTMAPSSKVFSTGSC